MIMKRKYHVIIIQIFFFNNNNNKECNNIRSISNKHINLELGQHLKHNRLKKDNNVSYNAIHKIYIDAGK